MKLPIRYFHTMPKESVLGATISLTLATLLVKVLGFLYKIPLAHILGSEGMSYFNSAYAVYSFFFVIPVKDDIESYFWYSTRNQLQ